MKSRWTRPVTGERLKQFDNRKTCMVCRAPIVCIHRYGRIINKTAIDLMERSFFQKFEAKFARLKNNADNVASEIELIEAPKRGDDTREIRDALDGQQQKAMTIAIGFLALISDSEQ